MRGSMGTQIWGWLSQMSQMSTQNIKEFIKKKSLLRIILRFEGYCRLLGYLARKICQYVRKSCTVIVNTKLSFRTPIKQTRLLYEIPFIP